MKKIILFTGCFALCHAQNPTLQIPQSSLNKTLPASGEQDEVNILEQMILTTTSQLEIQKKLKELMVHFIWQKDEFIRGNQTKAHTSSMLRTARQIHQIIQSSHIEHLFAKDYLDDITFFSSIAGKAAITRP